MSFNKQNGNHLNLAENTGYSIYLLFDLFYFRYESSAAEYKSAVEDTLTNVIGKSHQEERKTSDSTAPCTTNTTFLVNEVQFSRHPFIMYKIIDR